MSQNVSFPNATKWFEDEPNRSYRFGVTSVQSYYGTIFKQLVECWCLRQSCNTGPGDDKYENLSQIGVTVSELRVFKVTMEEILKQLLECWCLEEKCRVVMQKSNLKNV